MAEPWTDEERTQISEHYRRRGWARCPADSSILKALPVDYKGSAGSIDFECKTCGRHGRASAAA
ncbi:MAG: hypothetical protein ACHREM_03880 [Polyangiales bacterium]